VRLVIVNRRDYSGSSKYTDDEINDLLAGRKSFMERLALQVTYFLQWFIRVHNTPCISSDRKSGGLVIMGWSLGNATSLSFLGHPDVVPQESYQELVPFLKRIIIFGQTP
jgi:hypothetical protein